MPRAKEILSNFACSGCDQFPEPGFCMYLMPCTHTYCCKCAEIAHNRIYCNKCKGYFAIELCESNLLKKLIRALPHRTDVTSEFLNQPVLCQCCPDSRVTRFCENCNNLKCNKCVPQCISNEHFIRHINNECDSQFNYVSHFLTRIRNLPQVNRIGPKCGKIRAFAEMCTAENNNSVLLLQEITRPGGLKHKIDQFEEMVIGPLDENYKVWQKIMSCCYSYTLLWFIIICLMLTLTFCFMGKANQQCVGGEHLGRCTWMMVPRETKCQQTSDNIGNVVSNIISTKPTSVYPINQMKENNLVLQGNFLVHLCLIFSVFFLLSTL